MAVNKVVNKSTKSHGAMRNIIEYVLKDEKVKEGYVAITGPYSPETINWDGVYNAFLSEKKLWDKDTGRMYAHNIISFHTDEQITPEQCLEIGKKFVDKFFPSHQNLIGVHQDKDHLHIHIVTNSVSYLDGLKLHQTKHDLDRQKAFTNRICQERGLSVNVKGKHFDGTEIEQGQISAWSKDKYNLFQHNEKKSFVADCAIAVIESKEACCCKVDFIERMEERGWYTTWCDTKKYITFQNDNGEKVRDSNLSKTFSLDISKEVLLYEFERHNELRRTKFKSELELAEQLGKYYSKLEACISGTGSYRETIRSPKVSYEGERHSFDEWAISRSDEDTASLIRKVRTDISLNRTQNRVVADTENESISDAEQRCIEEEKRVATEERARTTQRRSYHHSEHSL